MSSKLKFAAALSMAVGAATAADAAVVSLSIAATPTSSAGGTYQVFAAVTDDTSTATLLANPSGKVAGIASFAIDIEGTGGAAITSRTRRAPLGIYSGTDPINPDAQFGFTTFNNGTLANGRVSNLFGRQNTSYGDANDPASDYLIVPGVGIDAVTNFRGTTVSFTAPVLLAEGAYTGSVGSLSVSVPLGSFVNLLQDTSTEAGRQYTGPGRVEAASLVVPGTAVVPEPATLAVIGLAAGGLLLRRRRVKA
jgi:hypothetical protein